MTFSFRQGKGVIYNNRLNQEYDLDKPKDVIQLCYEINNLLQINADFFMKLQDEKKKNNQLKTALNKLQEDYSKLLEKVR